MLLFFPVQVRFHDLKTVFRVATKAGGGDPVCYTSQYRLAYSEDCSTFNNILDGAGNKVENNIFNCVTGISLQ